MNQKGGRFSSQLANRGAVGAEMAGGPPARVATEFTTCFSCQATFMVAARAATLSRSARSKVREPHSRGLQDAVVSTAAVLACVTNTCLLSSHPRTWAVPSESLQGERRVPMTDLTQLLLAAAVLALALLALGLMP